MEPHISDEGMFIELVHAMRIIKMVGEILNTRQQHPQIVQVTKRFLDEVKPLLAEWSMTQDKLWIEERGNRPTADGCYR